MQKQRHTEWVLSCSGYVPSPTSLHRCREAFQHGKHYSTAPAQGDEELPQSPEDNESSAEGYQ